MQEPGCAVRSAVLAGQITARRYESYRRLFRLYEKLST
jgi:putative ribosome biogenesis GTPase RsgA